jgi:hypothetical protein
MFRKLYSLFPVLLLASAASAQTTGELRGDLLWCNAYEGVFGPDMVFGDTPIIQKVIDQNVERLARYRLDQGRLSSRLQFIGFFDAESIDTDNSIFFNPQEHEYLFKKRDGSANFLSIGHAARAKCVAVTDETRKILRESVLEGIPTHLLKPSGAGGAK